MFYPPSLPEDSEEVGDGVGDDVWHEAFAKLKDPGTLQLP